MKALHVRTAAASVVLAALGGCVVMPSGPSVMALPGTGKSFDQFRADDASCRQYALVQVGGVNAGQAANTSAIGSAALGTAVGAAAGAAFGGGRGAAIGAGAGLLTGGVVGAGMAQSSGYGVQQRYDYAYIQCMYAAGERVPVPASMVNAFRQQYDAPAPSENAPPPPPPPPRY